MNLQSEPCGHALYQYPKDFQIDTLNSGQNGWYFVDIFKCIFFTKRQALSTQWPGAEVSIVQCPLRQQND